MVWQVVFTALAAWGLLCALWACFGWLLSGSQSVTLVVLCPSAGILARLRWLDRLGLLRCRLIAIEKRPADVEPLQREFEEVEFCTLAALSARLEAERKELD